MGAMSGGLGSRCLALIDANRAAWSAIIREAEGSDDRPTLRRRSSTIGVPRGSE